MPSFIPVSPNVHKRLKVVNLPLKQFMVLECIDAYYEEVETGYLLYVVTSVGIAGYVTTLRDLVNPKIYKTLDYALQDAKTLGFSVRLHRNT